MPELAAITRAQWIADQDAAEVTAVLRRGQLVVPCSMRADCDYPHCEGWTMERFIEAEPWAYRFWTEQEIADARAFAAAWLNGSYDGEGDHLA